jgi:uncharacterized Zn-binding protein involved in type VI secretion
MPDRYFITLGTPTTAGGKVTTANHFETIEGVPLALAGDSCWCPACDSEGVISPDGPRLGDSFEGRELALADDLCICRCSPPPRLVAAQTFMYQTIDSDWHAEQAVAAATAAATANAAARRAGPGDRIPLVLIDPDTQEPIRHRRYRLELATGPIEGTTDQHGWTRPLSAAERDAVLAWHVQAAAT